MTSNEILRTNFDKVVKVANVMLKAAEDQTATPQDVVNVLANVVEELLSLKDALPGGEQESQAPVQAPPGQQAEPAPRVGSLSKDTAEESREKVNEQNAAQLALHEKTFKALQARIDELESEKAVRVREDLAEQVADLYASPSQRQAKFDEVLRSDKPDSYWETFIEAGSELTTGSIKPAKTGSTWLPTKTAKQVTSRIKTL